MKSIIISFGILITCLLILFQLAKFTHFRYGEGFDWWMALFSGLFLVIGILINRKSGIQKKSDESFAGNVIIDEIQLKKIGLSNREYEVLKLISEGLSNQQIANRLFLSENTIKKHISNLFLKMGVERRTEAVKKAKDIKILA